MLFCNQIYILYLHGVTTVYLEGKIVLSYYDLVHVHALRAYGSLFVCVCVFFYIVSVTLILEVHYEPRVSKCSTAGTA